MICGKDVEPHGFLVQSSAPVELLGYAFMLSLGSSPVLPCFPLFSLLYNSIKMLLDTAAMYHLCFRFSGEMMREMYTVRIETGGVAHNKVKNAGTFYDDAPRKNVKQ